MTIGRHRRILKFFATLYGAYLLFSVGVLLPLINLLAKPVYQHYTGRELHYQLLGFNPLTLAVFGYQIEDRNPDGSPFWSVKQLIVNPSLLASGYFGALGIDEVRLLGLRIQVSQCGANQYNFSDILQHRDALKEPTTDTPPTPDSPFQLPRIWIGELELDAQLLQFTDAHRAKPFTTGLRDFHFVLADFSTLNPEGDGYFLRANSAQGGAIEWQGEVAAQASKTWGRILLSDFSLLPLWQFMEPQLNFDLAAGHVDVEVQYNIDWSNALRWFIEDSRIALNEVALAHRPAAAAALNQLPPAQLRWQRLSADIARLDGNARTAQLNSLDLTGLSIGAGHAQGRVGLADMFSLNDNDAVASTSTSPSATPQGQTLASRQPATDIEDRPWNLTIDRSQVHAARIGWQVEELDGRLLQLDPIDIRIDHLNLQNQPAALVAQLQIDQQTNLTLAGELALPAQSADIQLIVEDLPLAWANPMLDDHLEARIVQGLLRLESQLQLRQAKPIQAEAQLHIDNFQLDDLHGERLVSIAALQLQQLHYDHPAQQLRAESVHLKQLATQLHILPDGSTNLGALIKPPAATAATDTPGTDGQRLTPAPTWQLRQLELEDARIQFTDQTPLSTFSTQIQQFSGAIRQLSSDAEHPWQVALAGNVDGYAPVSLKGQVMPLRSDPTMDLALDFTAMDLGVFNPYSTTFTGWQIEKGLLSVHLNYQLTDKRIVGHNRVVLDQLTLGERVDSRRLIDIPVRLALALLTDEKGVADLAVPVRGTTDDPSFSIGAVVWGAVRNSIMKLVTAPFSFLASLVGTQEDLGQADFPLLSAEIGPEASPTLQALHAALLQRPQLRLGISGDVDAEGEGRAIKTQQLAEALLAAGLSEADINARNPAWRAQALKRLARPTESGTHTDAELHDLLLEQLPAPTEQLHNLAQARAIAVKQALTQQLGLSAERLFVKAEPSRCPRDERCQGARVVFSIEP